MHNKLRSKRVNYLGAIWGILGLTLIFIPSIYRALPYVVEALKYNLSYLQWVALVVWCMFMVVTEGYRGFQKQFSPRVASRMLYLLDKPKNIDLLLAPLFCMGYFHATRKRLMVMWSLTFGIALIVFIVRHFSQPWRGIVDLGVVIGLLYGLVSTYYFMFLALKTGRSDVDPEVGQE